MKNNGLGSLRFLGCAFLVVAGLSFQGCKSSGSGIKPDAAPTSGNTAGTGGEAGEGGNGGKGGASAGGTSVAGSTDDRGGACPGTALLCCGFSGSTEDAIVATCTGGKWTCPGGTSLTQTTETSCCLPDGGTIRPVCAYHRVECRSGSSPCQGSVTDGDNCAGDRRYCCPFFGSTPFPAPYCLGGQWVCPSYYGSVFAGGAPGVCCLPDGGTAPTECVGDIIQCSPFLGGTLCDPADAGHD